MTRGHPVARFALGRNRLRIAIITIFAAFMLPLSPLHAAVEVTDIHGNTASVDVFEVTKDEADLLLNNRRLKLKKEEFPEDSWVKLTEYAKENGKLTLFPDVRIEVNVSTKRRQVPGSFYQKTMRMKPVLSITGKSTMAPIPEAEATFVLIAEETSAKYRYRTEELSVLNVEKMEIPAVENGNKRTFEFEEIEQTYDADKDYTNIGGLVYKYYIFGLRDPETSSIVYFETNDPELRQYIGDDLDRKERFLALKKGSKFIAGDEKPEN